MSGGIDEIDTGTPEGDHEERKDIHECERTLQKLSTCHGDPPPAFKDLNSNYR
jgi:hypothetical protein